MIKFLKYLLSYLTFPFSFLVPRSRKKIAFGSYKGTFDGNAKYLFIEMSEKGEDVVWLSPNRGLVKRLRSLGLCAESVFSLRGAWRALRSRIWFVVREYAAQQLAMSSISASVVHNFDEGFFMGA